MTRFHKSRAGDATVELIPVGWRKLPLLRRLPYFTGDQMAIELEIKNLRQKAGSQVTIVLDGFDFRENSDVRPLGSGEVLKERYTFRRFPNSGEYTMWVNFDGPGTLPQAMGGTDAEIQVVEDWKILVPIGSLLLVALTAIITLLVQRLF